MVPLKRSRVSSFSIFDGDGVGVTTKQSQSPETRRSHRADRRPVAILTVSSPDWRRETETEKESGRVQNENFLEQCGFCKKKLGQNDVVFMYGNLGAFCTPECRGKQMTYDKFLELSKRVQSKKGRTCCNRMDDSDDHTVRKQETCAAPRFLI